MVFAVLLSVAMTLLLGYLFVAFALPPLNYLSNRWEAYWREKHQAKQRKDYVKAQQGVIR